MPIFLKNDYMNDYTPRSKVILAEMNEPIIEQPMDETRDDVVMLDMKDWYTNKYTDSTFEMTSTQVPCHSGKNVRPTIRFIGLGETYEVISKEAESDPYTYEEAMNDIDTYHWVKAMKSELDSMYSNQVWDLVKPPNGLNMLVANGFTRGREG